MKFCLATTFFPPQHFGGDAIAVSNLANLLAQEGHEVHVIHCADSFELLRGQVPLTSVALRREVQVHTLRSSWGFLSPLATYLTGHPGPKAAELERLLNQDFDVIHWHNLSLVAGAGAIEPRKAIQLCTLHDYWWICPTSLLFKHTGEACEQRECFRCLVGHRRPPQLWRASGVLRSAIANMDRFLAPSSFVKERYRESPLALESTVLPHAAMPARPNVAVAKQGYYLFAGRLSKEKGLQTVIPLFGATQRTLKIAGAGHYEAHLRALAAPYPNIEFLGAVHHNDLPAWYAGARATIVPSICYETFGLTALESLQQKTPVIVSGFGGLPEIVANTGGGVTYGSLEELKAHLDHLDTNPNEASALGNEGSRRLKGYSPETHLERYFEIIREEQEKRVGIPKRKAASAGSSRARQDQEAAG